MEVRFRKVARSGEHASDLLLRVDRDGRTRRPPTAPCAPTPSATAQRILAAAAEVFAERGLDVSLDDIAAAAGVGVGTVYRRFPDKDALIDALFEEKIARHRRRCARARSRSRTRGRRSPTSCAACAGCRRSDRGLKEVLMSADRGRERVAAARDTIAPRRVAAAQRARRTAGALRADLGAVRRADDALRGRRDRRAHARRRARLLGARWSRSSLDGLRAQRDGTTPMPAAPLGVEQFTTVMTRRARA